MRRNARIAALALLALPTSSSLFAAAIFYEPVDLSDDVAGEDLWRYNYFVTGFTFSADQGFTIRFDIDLYRSLQALPANPDWDILVFQPDPNLPADGAYDALALANGASLADPFSVDFVFLGSGRPGSQPFELNQFGADGNLVAVLETGVTTLIPEPGPFLLTFSGVMALFAVRFVRTRLRRCPF